MVNPFIIPVKNMETSLPIFDTLDISGFVNIFLSFEKDKETQKEMVQLLVNREPNSLSGQAASRWLAMRSR